MIVRVAAAMLIALAVPAVAQEEKHDWILTFANGDTVHCRLHGLEGSKLTVYWEVAPDEPVNLDLKMITQAARTTEDVPSPPEGVEVLRLFDGSVLYGKAIRFTPDAVEFEIRDVGRVSVLRKAVDDLSRKLAGEIAVPAAQDEAYVVATKSGDVLVGTLRQRDDGKIVLEGKAIDAVLEYDAIALILFPRGRAEPEAVEPKKDEAKGDEPKEDDGGAEGADGEKAEGEAEETEKKPKPGVQVALKNGSRLAGKDPWIRDRALGFKLDGGQEVRIPLKEVLEMSFTDFGDMTALGGSRTILVWGRYSDDDDEFRKTINILKENLKGRWKYVEDKSEEFDRAFRRKLMRCRALVVPEMEQWGPGDPSALAAKLKPVAKAFLRSGGNIILCGVQNNQSQFLREADLLDIRSMGSVDGQDINFTRDGARLGKGLGGSFKGINATYVYQLGGTISAKPLAQNARGAVVVGRKVGRGWVLVLGMDFYDTNDKTSALLARAVTFR